MVEIGFNKGNNMFDFYFGTDEEIEKDPKKFLLTIKRMMPRWCNSIPDSEYLAIYDSIIDNIDLPDSPIIVETGSGASTIVLCYIVLKNNGELYTWDTNGSKLFYLRSIINDTLMKYFSDKNLNNHWKHIAYNSNSKYMGINILSELGKKVNACFLDSEHTLDILKNEIETVTDILDEEAILAIDDGNYSYAYQNTAYLNMMRKKLGIPAITNPDDNKSEYFWEYVDNYLKSKFKEAIHIEDTYKRDYQSDIFWAYFNSDRETMSDLSMEKTNDLEHRFDAWKIIR